jgi:hypothetical protein
MVLINAERKTVVQIGICIIWKAVNLGEDWHALEIWSSQYKFMLCLQLDMFELSATSFVEGGVTLWRK